MYLPSRVTTPAPKPGPVVPDSNAHIVNPSTSTRETWQRRPFLERLCIRMLTEKLKRDLYRWKRSQFQVSSKMEDFSTYLLSLLSLSVLVWRAVYPRKKIMKWECLMCHGLRHKALIRLSLRAFATELWQPNIASLTSSQFPLLLSWIN